MIAATMPEVGEKAPSFSLSALPDGKAVKLADFKGKKVVLYFYPKDMTPGCTSQACDFRDANEAFAGADAVVLGISPDGIDSHRKFAEKYELPFPLLADEGHALAEKYGVWVEKSMYGRKYLGVQRATFLIDREGKVAAVWPKVKVPGHVAEVAAKIAEIE